MPKTYTTNPYDNRTTTFFFGLTMDTQMNS